VKTYHATLPFEDVPAFLMALRESWALTAARMGAAKIPHGHWKTMTFLAALRCDRIEAPWVLDELGAV
jgi:hypothetical protein